MRSVIKFEKGRRKRKGDKLKEKKRHLINIFLKDKTDIYFYLKQNKYRSVDCELCTKANQFL